MAFEILIVEDNPLDVELVQEGLAHWQTPHRVHVVHDGDQAIDFLRRHGRYAQATSPDMILLDLNLPKRTGTEVLEEIKADHDLALIPVVVLSTSDSESDVKAAYARHANCYVTKPLQVNDFIARVKAIEDFWLRQARLPRLN